MKKNILGIILRLLTTFYVLFALSYGIICSSIDLTGTINFQGDSLAIAAARQKQLFIACPYIILGSVLLILLIISYASYSPKVKIGKKLGYGIAIAIVGSLFVLGFVGIAVYIKEKSLILCIIPAICMLIYGIFLICTNKTNKKQSNSSK